MSIREGEQRHRFLPNAKSDGSDPLRREGWGVGLQRIAILLKLPGKPPIAGIPDKCPQKREKRFSLDKL